MGTLWYCLVVAMLIAYVALDGFDIGAGIIHLLAAKSEDDKQLILRTVGPVWDGNEVWLIAAGGTLYFAFPLLYASAFSGFYLPLMMLLWLLILRAIGIELRMHFEMRVWHEFFDGCFAFASIALAFLLGALLGNIVRGVPLGEDGSFFLPLWTNWLTGPDPGVFDWYTVLCGLLTVTALAVHGALYVAVKTENRLRHRAIGLARRLWGGLVMLTAVSLLATLAVRPSLVVNYTRYPSAYLAPIVVVASLAGMLLFSKAGRDQLAFLSSSFYLAAMTIGAGLGLYPVLLPSSTGTYRDISVSGALTGSYALSIGLIWWAFGILLAIVYFIVVYRMFAGKVRLSALSSAVQGDADSGESSA